MKSGRRAGALSHLDNFIRPALLILSDRHQQVYCQARRTVAPVLPESLDDLNEPAAGILTLGVNLYWNGDNPHFDLADPDDVRMAYQIVLREAANDDQLAELINPVVLAQYWSRLRLPERLRALWESVHPQLAQ